jgi:hypothetical protein
LERSIIVPLLLLPAAAAAAAAADDDDDDENLDGRSTMLLLPLPPLPVFNTRFLSGVLRPLGYSSNSVLSA